MPKGNVFALALSLCVLAAGPACDCGAEPLATVVCDFQVTPSGPDDVIEFPETAVFDSRVRAFRIENTGNQLLASFNFAFDGVNEEHYRLNVPEDFQLEAGADATINVVFQPVSLSGNLATHFNVTHDPLGNIGCPFAQVFVDGASFERPDVPDGGPRSDGGDALGPDGGVEDDGGVTLPDGGLLLNDAGAFVDAGTITPPGNGIGLGTNPRFEAQGALTGPRSGSALVTLRDGSLLLVGGYGENGAALNTIERYDPVTEVGTIVGTMALPRAEPGATLLSDGRVAIAGGLTGVVNGQASTTIEIFDPAQSDPALAVTCPLPQGACGADDILQGNGALSVGRIHPVVVQPPDNPGPMLVVALGRTLDDTGTEIPVNGGDVVTLAEPYAVSPLTGAGTLKARQDETRIFGAQGAFLLLGGMDEGGLALDEIIRFDPAAISVAKLPVTLLEPRRLAAATLREDGSLLLGGGLRANGAPSTTAESITDPFGTAAVALVDVTLTPRVGGTLVTLPGDFVFYAGGTATAFDGLDVVDSIEPLTTADLYVPVGPNLIRLSPDNQLAVGRIHHHVVVVGDNSDQVLFLGGDQVVPRRSAHGSVERYDIATNRFEVRGLLGAGAAFAPIPIQPDGGLLSVGGFDPHTGGLSARARYYDNATRRYFDSQPLLSPRRDFTLTQIDDFGYYLVTGGVDAAGQVLDSATLFNPLIGTDTALPVRMNHARSEHSATLIDDGTVLLCGGKGPGGEALDTCEVFEPPSNTADPSTWETDPPAFVQVEGRMSAGRFGHTATLLDGEVLLVGGGDIERDQVRADLFDVASRSLFATGQPLRARRGHTATALGSGRVLLTGGETFVGGLAPTNTAEVYERQNGIFLDAPPMTSARVGHGAFLLGGGDVLVVGGARLGDVDFPSRSLVVSELYSPGPTGVGEWSPIDIDLSYGRSDLAAIDVYGRAMIAYGTHRDGRISTGNARRSPVFFVDRLVNDEE